MHAGNRGVTEMLDKEEDVASGLGSMGGRGRFVMVGFGNERVRDRG